MMEYTRGSDVTGASMSDFLVLYEHVRTYRPKEILELGTGVSSVVMAHAMLANAADGHGLGRITSMEEDETWHRTAVENLPENMTGIVDIIHSPKIDGFYKMFRGVRYTEIPDRPYEFVFSDGPERHSLVNGDKLFDLDLILVVLRSERPVRAIVDNHYLTFYVLQKVFGLKHARYSVSHRLMFVGPVNKYDARYLRKENFIPDLRLFAKTELKLRMALREKKPPPSKSN
jgi:hypothetical protein